MSSGVVPTRTIEELDGSLLKGTFYKQDLQKVNTSKDNLYLKALVKEDTLLPIIFLGLCKLGNICCRRKMFLNKIRKIFLSWTQNLCPQQMFCAQANRETFVSATMCPCLPGPLQQSCRVSAEPKQSFQVLITPPHQVARIKLERGID